MAYATSNAPRLVAQSVGANGGDLWVYKDGDSLDDVASVNYVTNATDLGMVAGDVVLHIDETDLVTNLLTANAHRTSGTAVGALCSAIEPIGESTIALQSAGTGTLVVDDIVTFSGDTTEYRVTEEDTDVSDGGTFDVTPTLVVATAVGTTITVKSNVINLVTGKTGRKVHASSAATRLLQPSESGDLFLFDSAGGQIFTLPEAVVGLKYSFRTTVTVTASDTYAVLCSTATAGDFFLGSVKVSVEGSATEDDPYFANGTSHLGISSNGSTTGGLIGGWIEVECITTTFWQIKGHLLGTGTVVIPYTT